MTEGNDTDLRQGYYDSTLQALFAELKYPLVNIARQAEIGHNTADFEEIQRTADQSLRLIDSYLLSAQAEYGQQQLMLEPVTIGSMLYDAAQQMRQQTALNNIEVIIDDRIHDPVITNRLAATSLLVMFGTSMLGFEAGVGKRKLIFRGYKTTQQKIGIGIFSNSKLRENDIKMALSLHGQAHMPLARLSQTSHASLAIAERLCEVLGDKLSVKRMGALSGFVTELPRSEQLGLV